MAPGKKRKRAMKGKEDTEKEEVEEVGKSEEGERGNVNEAAYEWSKMRVAEIPRLEKKDISLYLYPYLG